MPLSTRARSVSKEDCRSDDEPTRIRIEQEQTKRNNCMNARTCKDM